METEIISPKEFYKEQMKQFMNKDGLFPDTILGDDFWPLTYCTKVYIDGKLYWKFV